MQINAPWLIPIALFFISLLGFKRIKIKEQIKRGEYIYAKSMFNRTSREAQTQQEKS